MGACAYGMGWCCAYKIWVNHATLIASEAGACVYNVLIKIDFIRLYSAKSVVKSIVNASK